MTLVKFYPRNAYRNGNNNGLLNYSDLWSDFYNESQNRTGGYRPKVNIIEESGLFEVQFALAGIKKDQVKIDIDKDLLKVSFKNEDYNENREYHVREFQINDFERSFYLPDSVNTDKVEARMENGILSILLPKKKEAVDKGPKEIKIS